MNKKLLFLKLLQKVSKKKYFLIFISFFILSFIFFQSTFWYRDQSFFIKSKLWSDFAAHLAMIRSFSLGGNFFPTEYPMFAGEKIHYHFLFYLLTGALEYLGLRIDLAFNLLSAFGFSLLLTMIIKLGDYYFNFKTGLLAALLFLFNGSLTFVKFWEKVKPENFNDFIQSLVTQHQFVSFGPWDGSLISAFWNLNIFTNQRHLAFGLGSLLFLIYFFEKKFTTKKIFFSRKEIFLIGSMIILLPLIHQASFAFLGIYLLLMAIKNYKKFSASSIIFLLLTGLSSVFIYSYWGSSFTPIFKIGFLSKDKTFIGLLTYWLFNFGLYLFFIPLVSYFIVFKKKDFKKINVFYLTGLLVFILANLFQFSPDMINNHKFITLFLLVLNLVVASLLVKLFSHKLLVKKLGGMAVLILLTLSGIVDLFPILNDKIIVKKDYQQSELGEWSLTTPYDSVFLVNSYLYNPISLTGRKLYLDYGYFAWSMGYPDKERRVKQKEIFSATITKTDWCGLIKAEKIDYLVIDMREKNFLNEYSVMDSAFAKFSSPVLFEKSAEKYNIQLYNVKEICQ